MKYNTKTEKQTLALGKNLAKQLKGGEVLALTGELGAGKTVLTKGLAQGLGIKKIITSPTFTLMNVYNIKSQIFTAIAGSRYQKKIIKSGTNLKYLVHIDCYRLTDASELEDIGAAEYFNQPNAVVVIEWADKVKKILPKDVAWIEFKIKPNNQREITIK